jgi:hypothetical protein
MDSHEGLQTNPRSLHKYLYCHGEPVNNTDPSGKAVYVVTRPLDMAGLRRVPGLAAHVYLAFDAEGITNLRMWNDAVADSADTQQHPNTYGITYRWNDSPVTMSFHPRSVLNGDYTGAYYGPTVTPSSYVAYNASIDIAAFSSSGTGYNRHMVASGDRLQSDIFHFAVASRNANNNARPDPDRYSFVINNCGSWADHVLQANGVEFPDRTINSGMGLGGWGSGIGYAAHAGARAAGSGALGPGLQLINIILNGFL